MHLFIHSFMHSAVIRSFVCSFIHLFIRSFIHVFIYLSAYLVTHLFILSSETLFMKNGFSIELDTLFISLSVFHTLPQTKYLFHFLRIFLSTKLDLKHVIYFTKKSLNSAPLITDYLLFKLNLFLSIHNKSLTILAQVYMFFISLGSVNHIRLIKYIDPFSAEIDFRRQNL